MQAGFALGMLFSAARHEYLDGRLVNRVLINQMSSS
jgi:hypothetical protein